jgi:hypothetical protein
MTTTIDYALMAGASYISNRGGCKQLCVNTVFKYALSGGLQKQS